MVNIHYRRLPTRETVYRQHLLLDAPEVKITLAHPVLIDAPVQIQGTVVLEAGADAVWFTFPGRWYDIGRFHLADGQFTGLYVNILVPPRFDGLDWYTTDLFLDIWMGLDSPPQILDQDQLDEALAAGWITAELAARAEAEAEAIMALISGREWPPAIVDEWTLDRALAAL